MLEGSQADICMGKPIAFVGHMTYCPKCKGNFPIIDGVMTTTFYGRGVAVDGMKTACGAVLIASQFTDVVQWSTGSASSSRASNRSTSGPASVQRISSEENAHTVSPENTESGIEIAHFYSLSDDNGNPAEGYLYDLKSDDELHTKAGQYNSGETVTIEGNESTKIITWLNTDSGSRV